MLLLLAIFFPENADHESWIAKQSGRLNYYADKVSCNELERMIRDSVWRLSQAGIPCVVATLHNWQQLPTIGYPFYWENE